MGTKVGRACKVTLGANKILGMGTWSVTGGSIEQHEDSEFEDVYKSYIVGLKDGGTITFDGFYDPDDATGQTQLQTDFSNNTDITTLRLYIDADSYWTPDTQNPTSYTNVTSFDVGSDVGGVMTTSFNMKISGRMILV